MSEANSNPRRRAHIDRPRRHGRSPSASGSRFRGNVVLITGASSGIGQSAAAAFAGEGARLAINHHGDEEGAEETRRMARDARESAGLPEADDLLVRADVSDADEVDAMFERISREMGSLHVLINNAGIQAEAPAHATEVDSFDGPLAVNLRGPFLCSRLAIQHFRDRGNGGVIVNISSVHETIPKPMYIGYSASKGGLRTLTQTLALEYARDGIRVNSVAPGAVVTPMNESWVDDPEEREEVSRNIPMGRPAETDDIDPVILFLASDEARYITGQTIFVDGGLTLYPAFETAWSS